jgi:hypothetical protein
MEYWSFGVMGENLTGEYKPCFRAYRDTINFRNKRGFGIKAGEQ